MAIDALNLMEKNYKKPVNVIPVLSDQNVVEDDVPSEVIDTIILHKPPTICQAHHFQPSKLSTHLRVLEFLALSYKPLLSPTSLAQ